MLERVLMGSAAADDVARLTEGSLRCAQKAKGWAARRPCPACGGFVPAALLVPHVLACEAVKPVGIATRCDAEVEVALLDGRCEPPGVDEVPARPPNPAARLVDALPFEGAMRGIMESVLETLVGHVTPKELRTPVVVSFGELSEPDELVTAQRAASATKEGASSILQAVTYACEWAVSSSKSECPWCHAAVAAGKLAEHLVGCGSHPEALRGRLVSRWLEAHVGRQPLPVAGIVASLQASRVALGRLIRVCAWFESEFGWDGEQAYIEAWAEEDFAAACARASAAITPSAPEPSAEDSVTQGYAAELDRVRRAVAALVGANHSFVQRFRDSDLGKATIRTELEDEWKRARARAAESLGRFR